MGKLVRVNAGFQAVSLPPRNLPFNGGQSTTLTNAEFAALPAATLRAITVIGTPSDPARPTPYPPPQSLQDAVDQAVEISNAYTDAHSGGGSGAIPGTATVGNVPAWGESGLVPASQQDDSGGWQAVRLDPGSNSRPQSDFTVGVGSDGSDYVEMFMARDDAADTAVGTIDISLNGDSSSAEVYSEVHIDGSAYPYTALTLRSGLARFTADPQVILTGSQDPAVGTNVDLRAIAGQTGPLFQVQDKTGDTTYLGVHADGTLYGTGIDALPAGVVSSVVPGGSNVHVDDTDPANPVISVDAPSGGVISVEPGSSNVHVDATDPANPVISVDEPSSPLPDGFGAGAGTQSIVEGGLNVASGNRAHAEGGGGSVTVASGFGAHAEGSGTTAAGDNSHAEGEGTQANGDGSHAEGGGAIADGDYSHAANQGHAIGPWSYAENQGTTTIDAEYSHAEGLSTTSAAAAHSEGRGTLASADAAHAEGEGTTASGIHSHAEGNITTASGPAAHAEGVSTVASGDGAHAEGHNAIAARLGEHASSSGGNSQYSRVTLFCTNFGDTVLDLGGDGSSQLPLTNNCMSLVRLSISANDTGGHAGAWALDILVNVTSGTAVIIGSPVAVQIASDSTSSGWTVEFAATGLLLAISVNIGGSNGNSAAVAEILEMRH